MDATIAWLIDQFFGLVVGAVVVGLGGWLFHKTRYERIERKIQRLEERSGQVDQLQGLSPEQTRPVSVWYGRETNWHDKRVVADSAVSLRFDDEGHENVIRINKAYRVEFNDPRHDDFWWDRLEGGIRTYRSGPHSAGHGFKRVRVTIRADDDS